MKSSAYAFIRKAATVVGLLCAVSGYWFVGSLAPKTGCGPVTFSGGMNCGVVESLVYRFSNFASMLGALVFALPAIVLGLWAWAREDDTGPANS